MHKKFDHRTFEKKWQEQWQKDEAHSVSERTEDSDKEYVLVEWPYPSGNLHIGHWYAFAVPDIYVRAHRMQGKQVIFPMGFDAFGLPAENAAIKRNLDPREWTESNIAHMKKQLESMGNAFTWDMSTSSTDLDYYKWTQWMFTKFFENDIAYKGTGTVNWCPSCNTILANEQVINGACERCDTEIEKREMEEWKMRITKYADRLIDDLDALDWPEHIKESQRQWIGRSEGSVIPFQLSTGNTLEVFTTRADTLAGATYMVLAPEHPVVNESLAQLSNAEAVKTYRDAARKKSEQDRTAEGKEKTGVQLEGITALNPLTKEDLPVYIADYVLAGYGTGAIMAVPAHDERDYAFATAFNLPIRTVIEGEKTPHSDLGTLINSGTFDGTDSETAKALITEAVEGRVANTYRLRDWSIGRQRYWGVPIPIVYDPNGEAHPVPEEHLPWTLPSDVDFTPTGEPPLAKSGELKRRTEEIFGTGWTPAVETMDTFVDSSWYFLRYIDNGNDTCFASLKRQKEWMPVDIYFGGAEHTTMHLLYSRFWQKVLFDLELATADEPYTKRINRGLVLGPDGNKMSKSKGNVIDPDEQVVSLGADAVKMYLAFMGPYGEAANYPWDLGGIAGVRRFLERVNGLDEHIADRESTETSQLFNKTIKKVTEDIDAYKFNTAISAMMIFVNHAEKNTVTRDTYKTFLKLLAPFAPHLTEELWCRNGNATSIHAEAFPSYNAELINETSKTIAVQVNGKVRGTVTVPGDAPESDVLAAAKADVVLAKKLPEDVTRIVYVPGRIINVISNHG